VTVRYSRALTDAFISIADEIEEDEDSIMQVHGVCIDEEEGEEAHGRDILVFEVKNEDGVQLFSLPSSSGKDGTSMELIEEQAIISLRAAEMAGLIR